MTSPAVCPYCLQPIGARELENIHRAEAESLHAQKEAIRAELAKEIGEANAARQKAEERAERLREETELRIKDAVTSARADSLAQMEEANRKAAESEKRLAALLEEMEAKVDEAESRARRDAEASLYKDIHEKDKKLDAAQKTIDALQKRLEARPAHEIGSFQEDELVRILQAEFPRDRIQLIPGVSGADIEHEVMQDGESCGLIVYESKNALTWQSAWVPKLKQDALAHGASFCILTTRAFPPKSEDFTSVDGVPVVHPRFLVHLVRIVRRGLVDVKAQSLSRANGGYKLEQLMSYLNGPDFRNRMQSMFGSVRKLEEIQQKERKAHDKTWTDQGALFRSISVCGNEIDNELKAILLGH